MGIRQMIKPHGTETITRGGCEESLTRTPSSSPMLICFEFLEASLHALLSFTWTITRPTNLLRQNIVFSYSEMIPVSFSFFLYFSFLCYFVVIKKYMYIFFILFIFFHENVFIFSCSGMFRNVPCSWFYRRPIATQLTTYLFKTGPDS